MGTLFTINRHQTRNAKGRMAHERSPDVDENSSDMFAGLEVFLGGCPVGS